MCVPPYTHTVVSAIITGLVLGTLVALSRPERSIPAKAGATVLRLTHADDELLRVPDSKAPRQCRVGPYSGDDALRRDGIQQHHLDP